MRRDRPRRFSLAPDVKSWSGYFPNPLKVLDRTQLAWTAAVVTSATFVFSPARDDGDRGGSRRIAHQSRLPSVDHGAQRSQRRDGIHLHRGGAHSVNRVGLPLSPVAADPAAPLFNAPRRFTIDTATARVNNLHSMLTPWEFLGYGLLGVLFAAVVAYPFARSSLQQLRADNDCHVWTNTQRH